MKGSTPKQRAKALKSHLAKIYDDGRGATGSNVVDMLTDLRHLCDAEGLNFSQCDRIARQHYAPEVAQNTVEAS